MDYAISPCDFRSTKESAAETTHVVGSLNQVWTNSAPLTQDQLETLPPNHEKTWVFQQCFTARDNARWLHCGISTSGWHALWFHTHLCKGWRKMLECNMKWKKKFISFALSLLCHYGNFGDGYGAATQVQRKDSGLLHHLNKTSKR